LENQPSSITPFGASPLILARGLRKTYRRGQENVEALHGIDLEVQPGSFVIIMGPSGGGKSTLLHLLGGIDRPSAGSLNVAGLDLENASEDTLTRFRRDHVGFVFQFYNLLPSINALENTLLPLIARGVPRRTALKTAADLLAQVGLDGRQRHKPGQLSGGEQQRVAIARAVASRPRLVLADEPTGDLDAAAADNVMALMRDFNHRLGITFIVATHNDRLVAHGDRLIMLRDGTLRER
jgi:ABC-type lipoprotein export system ATPase subunit